MAYPNKKSISYVVNDTLVFIVPACHWLGRVPTCILGTRGSNVGLTNDDLDSGFREFPPIFRDRAGVVT
jgi:hypothetical protein